MPGPVRIYVVMERNCPHCKEAFSRPVFRAVLRRPEVKVYALDDEDDVQEVGALWVGLSERERIVWAAGGTRGTAKTPAVIVDTGGEVKVKMPLSVEEDFEIYEQLASMLERAGIPFPPVIREPKGEKKKKGEKA